MIDPQVFVDGVFGLQTQAALNELKNKFKLSANLRGAELTTRIGELLVAEKDRRETKVLLVRPRREQQIRSQRSLTDFTAPSLDRQYEDHFFTVETLWANEIERFKFTLEAGETIDLDSETVGKLPIPVVGIPWHQINYLPEALVIGHEVGRTVAALEKTDSETFVEMPTRDIRVLFAALRTAFEKSPARYVADGYGETVLRHIGTKVLKPGIRSGETKMSDEQLEGKKTLTGKLESNF